MNKDTIEQYFSMHDWLREMFKDLPENIRLHWEVRKYNSEELICEQDVEVDSFYILVQGELAVERDMAGGISYVLATLHPGNVLGDIEISLDKPYIYRVYALKPSILLMLNAGLFKRWVMNDPYFLRRINLQLAMKLYQSGLKTIANNFYTVRHKLLAYFYEFIQSHTRKMEPYVLVASREELAKHLGVAVRSINRTISALKEEQVVRVKNRHLFFDAYSLRRIEQELTEKES
ncbi:Crp/Fnr family transcriptional regulator [Paenibacillus alginolyticus]|uniref:Crp/Fnr family transcriptional regulator n=1 Tax=Paenibacillus alginolyticus TaxID=59839 RepID=A0ABT4GAJ3_9BACL|nr:Crp/Fnr family transcriptional regulator [Paenibacillus alginolyticus]MCY9693197.1 Crp/Fnr family transcriptional regulator [Paenibacillus alginolyticus]MEC0144508.1 Crp/Fnr family transcriptional regulator [Paenibacillus alginolyticus]